MNNLTTTNILPLLHHPTTIHTLQLSITLPLSLLSGLALCLHQWAIPLIRISPTSLSKTTQFNLIITLGFQYLQPTFRLLAILIISTIILLYTHPAPHFQSQWKYYAAALAVLVPVGPYEEYFIFPINRRVKKLGEELRRDGKEGFGYGDDGNGKEGGGNEKREELAGLLDKWQVLHTVRVVAPLVASGILGWGMVR